MFVNEMVKSEKIEIRITIHGRMAERFIWLKDRFGIKNNSELLRLLISLVYRTEREMTYAYAIIKELDRRKTE